jgi:mannose-6-phosphate isomerase class I
MSRFLPYDKAPFVAVASQDSDFCLGWDPVADALRTVIARRQGSRTIVLLECYPGVDEPLLLRELAQRMKPSLCLQAGTALRPTAEIQALVDPFLGGNDPVFGFLTGLTLPSFFDQERLAELRQKIERTDRGLTLVVGCGASLLAEGDILVYADLARWEAQNRFRRHETGNLGADNRNASASDLYKRAFFVDWRVADRWKRPLLGRCDFLLDTHQANQPKLIQGQALRQGLQEAVRRPFRVVPFFDPAPWGGQWMKERFRLDPTAPNYGWCFDCVPEENSLLLGFGPHRVEIPSINVVSRHPRELLGEEVHARFGDEFPIRFDFLDTMGGGNLSFQVHPLTEYIQQNFGMHYTQDESYYLLDAKEGASVYLGLRDQADPAAMARDLGAAQAGEKPFDADRYANRWPAKKHDHFLIPAGTVHCSGADSMVLEISATPYIFTFKMWDWGRLGLDGKPRPIHLKHGLRSVQWDRRTAWVEKNLINRACTVAQGSGWREERTGLHEREFIETRRHWFTGPVHHDTRGGVNVLNLVEGDAAIVESPDNAFAPFPISYAETFIVPAKVGPYRIRPAHPQPTRELATLKAYVRT